VHVSPAARSATQTLYLPGTVSLKVMVVAAAGPPLVTVCEYVIVLASVYRVRAGRFVTLRSASPAVATPISTVASCRWVCFRCGGGSSGRVCDYRAEAVPAFTLTTAVKVLDEPGAHWGWCN